jgi:hypothetical protein
MFLSKSFSHSVAAANWRERGRSGWLVRPISARVTADVLSLGDKPVLVSLTSPYRVRINIAFWHYGYRLMPPHLPRDQDGTPALIVIYPGSRSRHVLSLDTHLYSLSSSGKIDSIATFDFL